MADDTAPSGEPWKRYQKQPAAPAAPTASPWTRYQQPSATTGGSTTPSSASETATAAPPASDGSTSLGTFFRNIPHGLMDLVYGGAQVGARTLDQAPDVPIYVPDAGPDPERIKEVDEATKKRAEEIAKEPGQKTHPWAAGLGDLTGQIIGTAPLFAPLGGLPSVGTRVVAAAVPGSITALMEPTKGDFASEKPKQVVTGTIGAMVGEPVGEVIGKGVRWAARQVGDVFRDPATVAARKAAEEETAATTKAGKRISETVAEGERGGGPTAKDILQDMDEAKRKGQPYTVMDVGPTETERLAGTAYRSPGGGATRMKQFQKERTTQFGEGTPQRTAQTQRIAGEVQESFGTESAKKAGERLATERSANARPLYEKAYEGGSMAPLEQQFGKEFEAATKAETLAAQRVTEVRTKLTPLLAKQSQAGNVYSAAAVNPEARAAAGELTQAEAELAQARQAKEAVRTRLQQAQADGTANAKGAVWSPRLQEFLDDPDIKAGLRHGAKLERDRALADGRPFNPTEYAIVGADENGEPIVGAVPNMKLLQKGKEALDARLYSDGALRDKFGRKTEEWWVLDRKRRAYVKVLDELNPDYKAARDAWAEGSAMMEALQFGKDALKDLRSDHLTVEEMTERWNDFSASEREVFKLGLGDQLVIDLDRARTSGTPANAIINSNAGRELIRTVFNTNEEFETFMRFLGREQRMSDVGHLVMKGSQSIERAEATGREANRMDAAHHVVQAISRARHLDPRAAASLWRAARALRGGSQDEAYNRKLVEMLTDPNIELSVGQDGKLLVGPQVPPRLPGFLGGPAGGDIGALLGSRPF